MVLIGMLDSPYVRRCAVSFKLMGVPFEHRSVSVFRHVDEFKKVNPVVKAPTLVCDDGTVLMDSTLILDYVESTLPAGKRLTPQEVQARKQALHITGFALAAMDKGVSIIYEKERRPPEKMHAPWMDRVVEQVHAALQVLEPLAANSRSWLQGERMTAADVVTTCMWRFNQYYNHAEVPASKYPALKALSEKAEKLPEYSSTPLD